MRKRSSNAQAINTGLYGPPHFFGGGGLVVFDEVPTTWLTEMGGLPPPPPPFLSQNLQVGGAKNDDFAAHGTKFRTFSLLEQLENRKFLLAHSALAEVWSSIRNSYAQRSMRVYVYAGCRRE